VLKDSGMVENREQQKTRYQGVVHVVEGNFYMDFGPPGSGLCVSATAVSVNICQKINAHFVEKISKKFLAIAI
jgi:hypothetical protein